MDVLRFAAAAVVVLNHARDLLWLDAAAVTPGLFSKAVYFVAGLGHEAVMVFFVLSGFWITRSVDRRKDDARFWTPYLIDRLSRLLIVLVPALVIGGLFDVLGAYVIEGFHYLGNNTAHSLPQDVRERLSIGAFLGNAAFLQSLVVTPFGSNGPLWSLAYEFWFYVWFPAIVLALRGRWNWGLAALPMMFIWPKLAIGFFVWLLGTALHYADTRYCRKPAPMKRGYAVILLGAGGAALGAALIAARLRIMPVAYSDPIVGVSFALFIWGLLRFEPRFPGWLRPAAIYGAGASFSLYVIHFPLLMIVLAIAGLDERVAPGVGSGLALAGLMLGAVGAAWVFSRFTEARTGGLRHWMRALAGRRQPQAS